MMSAKVTIQNECSDFIVFTNIDQILDDVNWEYFPKLGTKIMPNQSLVLNIGNDSFAPFAKGCGFKSTFVDSGFQIGNIEFKDPAVGAPAVTPSGSFQIKSSFPGGGECQITVSNGH
ncbi:hypothetical protein OAK35_00160 [Crocinitomicaceae bacterium]|nr:hypothetical protein [Crocinitomicaceae bacterium]